MNIEPRDYLQKLVETYQTQCSHYLQERVSLQAQLDLVLAEIERLETRVKELDQEVSEAVDVNTNTDS